MVAFDRVFKLIAEHTSDLLCIHDAENTIRFATRSSRDILGYSSDDIIGKKITDFLSESFIKEMDFNTLIRFFDHPGTRIRYQINHGDGRLRWLETTFNSIGDDPQKDYSILSSTRDITESVNLTNDLMEALSKEQELSRFKSNLYSIASHEFKTPLAVIQANIEMMKVKKTERVVDNAIGSMEEEVDRLNAMIGDMLELKKLTTGQTTFRPEKFHLKELIYEVIETNISKTYAGISVKKKFRGEEQQILGDPTLIRFVLANLLSNACKFSKPKSSIEITVDYLPQEVRFAVKDYGIGIPEDEQMSIFKSFYRAKNAGNIQGTGVGLAIVKEFVDLHKGKVELSSTPGSGSTFIVCLPI
jgi:PAS domain S-box-containing protein